MDAGLRRLREKYNGAPLKRPFFIDEQSWAIFTAYVYDGRSLREIRAQAHGSLSRLRQVLHDVDEQLERARQTDGITPQSPIEELALSIRARNALHRLNCRSIRDVLQLDLSGTVPRVGGKTRMEVLSALQGAGFRHPALDRGPVGGVTSLARSLDRMQERIDVALRMV